jgi:type II secretion system protein N
MPLPKLERWQIIAAYVAFAVAAFLFFFYVTFPYDALRQRLKAEAAAAGWDVRIASMGPGFFGVTAHGVEVKKTVQAGAPEGAEEKPGLMLQALSLRPSLFPFGMAFNADVMGGHASGAVGGLGTLSVKVELNKVDLAKGNLKDFSGLDLTGVVSGNFALTAPKSPVGTGPKEPDFGQASGAFNLKGDQVLVNGGTITVPMYGTPTPMDLPKIDFGNVDAKIDFEKGVGKIETFTAKSSDIDLSGTGTLKLARRLEYSEPNVDLRFKAEQDFVKRLGMLGAGLSMLKSDPKDPQYKAVKVGGLIGRPSFH